MYNKVVGRSAEGVISLRVYDARVQRGTAGACSLRRSACAQLCVPVSATDSTCRCAAGYERVGAACSGTCSARAHGPPGYAPVTPVFLIDSGG